MAHNQQSLRHATASGPRYRHAIQARQIRITKPPLNKCRHYQIVTAADLPTRLPRRRTPSNYARLAALITTQFNCKIIGDASRPAIICHATPGHRRDVKYQNIGSLAGFSPVTAPYTSFTLRACHRDSRRWRWPAAARATRMAFHKTLHARSCHRAMHAQALRVHADTLASQKPLAPQCHVDAPCLPTIGMPRRYLMARAAMNIDTTPARSAAEKSGHGRWASRHGFRFSRSFTISPHSARAPPFAPGVSAARVSAQGFGGYFIH